MSVQPGELMRRYAWQALDSLGGKKQQKLKKVNKREIVRGVTPEYQARRIAAILRYASANCPFYRQLPEGAALSDYPVQTKRDFIAHYEEIISDEFRDRREKLHRFTTSGSTGTPFSVLADDDKQMRVNMNFMSVMELNGFRLGMKRGEFRAWIPGKNTISDLRSFTNNLLMIDISNMGDESIRAIFDRIFSERIQVLVAYSSAVTALADYAERSGLDVSGWSVEMIFTMGEALPESTRRKCTELFGITPVLSYGNNENGFIAVSLPGEDVYTIDLFNFYVEILKMDSDEPAGEGELGRIVITDFYNRAFPMIRYDTGDTGIVRTLPDPGGRVRQVFTEIYGRRGSLIRNTAGEPLSTHVFMNNLLNFEGQLRQARCIQTGLTSYTLQLNPEMGARIDEQRVDRIYRSYLGDDAEIRIEYVEELPIERSGKTMVCVQECEEYL
ncbi:MAG: phenylacetate--CoA ligase family protein [Lachnospiraceae bacterium]|nr:phenylacetate--CoA ligase family protein [Lachnospiraceae bacterium]